MSDVKITKGVIYAKKVDLFENCEFSPEDILIYEKSGKKDCPCCDINNYVLKHYKELFPETYAYFDKTFKRMKELGFKQKSSKTFKMQRYHKDE